MFGQRSLAINYSEKVFRADFPLLHPISSFQLMDDILSGPQVRLFRCNGRWFDIVVGIMYGLQVVDRSIPPAN